MKSDIVNIDEQSLLTALKPPASVYSPFIFFLTLKTVVSSPDKF